MTGVQKVKLICFVVSICTAVLMFVCTFHLKTLLDNMAVTRVSSTVNHLVAAAVSSAVDSGTIQYNKLISFEKDHNGNIAALQSNIAEFNRLQSAITQDISQRLVDVGETTLSIPLGTLSGSPLLAGHGPRFSVKMQTLGSCRARFENQFSDAGINQTTHRILLYIDVSMSILLPGFRTHTTVSNEFSVAETVIVGAVPESYTYFHSGRDVEEEAYEYSLNQG
ncbi:MAG: sporulation protein YunB [Oscillospiraceae bacterium]|nr:sporulation protein YunB [Oscillospiraceae bacterium]